MELIRKIYFFVCIGAIGWVVIRHFWNKKKKKLENTTSSLTSEKTDKNKDEYQFTLELVNSWINNCDQKAGIVLAVVGVIVTVVMTSDFVKFMREYVFVPFMDYCSGNKELSFSWSRFTVFFLFVIAVIILITCCCYLFRAIRANIDYTKMYKENPELEKTSQIFYGTISGMKYDDFKKGGIEFVDDLKSQIYVNSNIATTKFQNYNEGLFWFKLLMLVSLLLFIAIAFVQ